MSNIALTCEAAVASLLAQPASTVAAALRSGAPGVDDVAVDGTVCERIYQELERATGSREWTLEHLRDHRPLGEVLEMARLISAQRRNAPARVDVSTDAPAALRRPRQLPHVRVPGRAASGLR